MSTYRYGEKSSFNTYIIIDDDENVTVAIYNIDKVTEYIGQVHETKSGIKRIIYGNGSSLPYKDNKGKMMGAWQKVK
jgi:hypothetical protein